MSASVHDDVAARITALRVGEPPAPDVSLAASNVVILGSSSRGGSSIFAEILRRSPRLLHFRGETNPMFRLCGLHGESDALEHEPVPEGLGRALGWECGQPTRQLEGDAAIWRFAIDLTVRLTLQWPSLGFGVERVHQAVREVLVALRQEEGWPEGVFVEAQAFHARLLGVLRRSWPEIHPGGYDIDRALLLARCPGPWPDPFLPELLVEEPPFVLITPWRVATEEQLATMPLVVKTPSNAYRMDWLRRFFRNATVRTLHLLRSVAASVNGLYDGWRYPGFHSHRMAAPLQIAGYTECMPGGDAWWKFDRPPGWEEYAHARLEDVCAFQWRSAHEALLRTAGPDAFRMRFEDVLGERSRQQGSMEALGRWLDLPLLDELGPVLAGALPVVMATAQPRARRWFSRIELLTPILADPRHRELMEALGYDADPHTWG